ncbi:MAG: T9SS type A sorting domain-containing protein [Candidatus Cloacimonetes bacterium]|nr:T9SS type A sorting domain-containing protein [Candidatus Cloacimonadota bacterium]
MNRLLIVVIGALSLFWTQPGEAQQSENCTLVGSHETLGQAIAVSGSLVLMGAMDLEIVDFSSPTRPVSLSSLQAPGAIMAIAVEGELAYLACGFAGLCIVDLHDPANPVIVGSLGSGTNTNDVVVSNGRAYLADGWTGIRIVDVTHPEAPAVLGGLDTPGSAAGVAVHGNVLWVADSFEGIRAIDVSDPSEPQEVGFDASQNAVYAIVADDSGVFAADHYGGLRILDGSDPAQPQELGWYITPGNPWDLALGDNLVYMADDQQGVRIIDISDPTSPVLAGYYSSGYAVEVAFANGRVHVADLEDGILVLEYHQTTGLIPGETRLPSDFGLRANTPNPFNPATLIHFSLEDAQHASLRIFDLRGRLVSSLLDGPQAPGAHSLRFDASALPSGTYLCLLETPSGHSSLRMTLLK